MATLITFEYDGNYTQDHGFVLAVEADQAKKIETLVYLRHPSFKLTCGQTNLTVCPRLKKVTPISIDTYNEIKDVYNSVPHTKQYLQTMLKHIEFVDFSFIDNIGIHNLSPTDHDWLAEEGYKAENFRKYDDPLTVFGDRIYKFKLYWHSVTTGDLICYQPTSDFDETLFSTGGYITEDYRLILTNGNKVDTEIITKQKAIEAFETYNRLHCVNKMVSVLVKKYNDLSQIVLMEVPYDEANKYIKIFRHQQWERDKFKRSNTPIAISTIT
jgi:hypothetical protein